MKDGPFLHKQLFIPEYSLSPDFILAITSQFIREYSVSLWNPLTADLTRLQLPTLCTLNSWSYLLVYQLDNNIVEWQRIRGVVFGLLNRAKSSSFAHTPYIKEEGRKETQDRSVERGVEHVHKQTPFTGFESLKKRNDKIGDWENHAKHSKVQGRWPALYRNIQRKATQTELKGQVTFFIWHNFFRFKKVKLKKQIQHYQPLYARNWPYVDTCCSQTGTKCKRQKKLLKTHDNKVEPSMFCSPPDTDVRHLQASKVSWTCSPLPDS